MRTALLAAIKRNESGELRSLMPLAGRSVLGWQTDVARQLECERVICLCEVPGPEILELQQETEALGGEFHAVRGNAQLTALLRADDELLIMLDGLVVDRNLATDLIGSDGRWSNGVFTCEPDGEHSAALSDHFERIDAERVWAGLIVMRADIAQRLAELPSDGDAISLLLRIALQSGVKGIDVPEAAFDDGSILLASSQAEMAERQRVLIERSALPLHWVGPASALSIVAGRQLQHAGAQRSLEVSGSLGIAALICGTALAWTGFGVFGLALIALGAFFGSVANSLFHLKRRLFQRDERNIPKSILMGLIDVLAVAAVIGVLAPTSGQIALFILPILTFGLVIIVSRDDDTAAKAFWNDRTLQFAVLAVAAAFGLLVEALSAFALAALVHKLLRLRQN